MVTQYSMEKDDLCAPSNLSDELNAIDIWWESDLQKAVEQLRSLDQTSPQTRWRLARALYNLEYEKDGKDSEARKAVYTEALGHAAEAISIDSAEHDEKGMSLGPKSAHAHKWYAIILSDLSGLQGTKDSIRSAFVIKDHFDKAAELNPDDPNIWYFLGRWSFSVASIGWWTRQFAATIFAKPPESTIDEALAYFEKAEAVQPGFWKSNRFFIAQCYLRLTDIESARLWLQKAIDMPVRETEEDRKTHADAEALLKTIPAATA